MKTYKVWVVVEQVDEEKDEYLELDISFSSTAEFDTEEKAQVLAMSMHQIGQLIVIESKK